MLRQIYLNIKYSLMNFIFYFKVIKNDRWYDYSYLLFLIDKKLEQLELNWVKNTHYVGAEFTKGRIIILRKYLKLLIEDDFESYLLYKKTRRKFFRYLERNYQKLWD